MQARPYRPDIGRYLTQDRFEQGAGDINLQADPLTQNRYAFAGGNPVNRVEFDGHYACPGGYCNGPSKKAGGGYDARTPPRLTPTQQREVQRNVASGRRQAARREAYNQRRMVRNLAELEARGQFPALFKIRSRARSGDQSQDWGDTIDRLAEFFPVGGGTVGRAGERIASLCGKFCEGAFSGAKKLGGRLPLLKKIPGLRNAAGSTPKLEDIVRPRGQLVGAPGRRAGIREVETRKQLDELFEQLRRHGRPTRAQYPGEGYDLPGGGFVGRRISRRFGPTLDVDLPDFRDILKVHVRDR